MNEDEMIKEVANLIYSCQFAVDCTGGHCDECLATALINLGYRKIGDDEIIIKRRQYEQLKKHNRDRKRLRLRWQQAKQELEQAKQESVRDFAKIVISAIWEEEENEKIKIKDVHDTIRDILRMNFGIELED